MKNKNIILLLFISLFVLIETAGTNPETDKEGEDDNNHKTQDLEISSDSLGNNSPESDKSNVSPNSDSSIEVEPTSSTKALMSDTHSLVNEEAGEGNNNPESNDDELKCNQTQPTKNIVDDCIENNLNSQKKCCYMEIKFKESTQYLCIPIDKNKETIKKEIKSLKENNDEYKSIIIDCSFKIIKFNVISIYLLLLFLFQ